MTSEKIEEFAKDIDACQHLRECEAWRCNGCEYEKYSHNYMCDNIKQAEALTAKDYRKSSDVAAEIFEELLGIISSKYAAVTTDCHYNMRFGNVDTPNGMRDLGKAEMLKYVGDKIAELKKKYTAKRWTA